MASQTNNAINTRDLVLSMLMEVDEKGAYSHLVKRQVLEKYQYLDKKERSFINRLFEGTIEKRIELDYIINNFSKTKVKKMKPLIRNLIRMSVYQLKYMDSIPDSAVCNEAVKLAKKHGFSQLSGFVNGVLRNIARNPEQISWPSEEKEPLRYLEVHYSMPEWIVKQFAEEYGVGKTREILEGFAREYPLTVRTNLTRITPGELQACLEEEGVSARIDEALPYALHISGLDYLNSLESFRKGYFYVQDISSMMVAETANPRKGDYVIDVCAAPGGKSTHLAEKMEGSGMVEARDLTDYKVELIEENIRRHGLANMKAVTWDATLFDPASVGKADILICDLPCSGLGVMGKKKDIRYKESPENEAELVKLQQQILDTVYPYVKPGGKLIYSTCTIHKAENEEMVRQFAIRHPEFTLESSRQIFPGEAGTDGFYLARLMRRENA